MSNKTFSEYISSLLKTPFKWGTNDCICFTIGWVSIAQNKDILQSFTFWDNRAEAFATIKKYRGLTRLFNKLFIRINPNLAVDGDLAIIGTTSYLFCGRFIVGPGENGLVFKDRAEVKKAWKINKE
jgi:hypothetical protein